MRTETDNRGKPLPVWYWREYELCENINMGLEGGWMFELTLRGERIAIRPTLKEGKQAAREHYDAVQAEARNADASGLDEPVLEEAS